ncbi:helix-turn-helix domain-containing protein [Bacillus toyonensis]|uniref:helix-turn-helix domain-containing protein n=1 Tax=Bacillus toyonensis TaxID=155322 RepID=UPI002175DE82|nr:helix-turn-helix domain-containing protein [Bacillus toyonensis]
MDSDLCNVIGVNEAASILNVSPGYVKNLCAQGKILAKKIGKTWVIDKSRLNEVRIVHATSNNTRDK